MTAYFYPSTKFSWAAGFFLCSIHPFPQHILCLEFHRWTRKNPLCSCLWACDCGKGHSPLGKKSSRAVSGLGFSRGTWRQATSVTLLLGVALLRSEQTQLDSQHVVPKGAYETILSGPQRLSKGEQVKSHFSPVKLCQFWFPHMPSFKLS